MKKLLKIFAYFIFVILILVIALLVTAKLAENKITDIALKKVSESIEAPVIISDVSFNLLRKFPLATIELKDVYLGSPTQLQYSDSTGMDTIINIGKIYISVKSKPLLKGNIEILKVDIDGATINYIVDTSGISNIDFLMDTTESMDDTTVSKPLNLTLTDLSVKNIICNFNDSSLKAKARILIPELKVKARMHGEEILASVKGKLDISSLSYDETKAYLMDQAKINFDIDYENDSVSIKQLEIKTDGANLNLLGSIILAEVIKTDLQFEGTELILGELIKYAPMEMLNEFGLQNVSGEMNMNASINGNYSESEMPHVDLNIELNEAGIVTNDYPELKNISCSGNLTNGVLRNNQSTQANFSSFHFETQQSKFDLAFSVLDLDDLKYDIKSKMNINIAEFRNFIPDSTIENIDGNIKASISTKGELPDSINDEFIDFVMSNSRATVELKNLNVNVDSSLFIENFSGIFSYKPNSFIVENLNIDVPTYSVELRNTSLNSQFFGSINNLSEASLNIESYHLETKGAEISGSVNLKNLEKPQYELQTRINLNLEETISMLPDSLLKSLSGKLSIDVHSEATLDIDLIEVQAMDIVFKNSTFNLNFENVSAEMPGDTLYKIEHFSGLVNMNPQEITINKMTGIAAGIEFGIDSTRIENVYNSVILNNKEQLFVDTRLNLGDLDYSLFAAFMETDSVGIDSLESKLDEGTNEIEPINYTMLIKGKAKVKSLTYGKVFVEDISTLFNVQDSVYILDQFKLQAFNGNMNTSVKYTLRPNDRSIIEMYNFVERMDVKKLLQDFDDFKDYYEPSISHKNLSGLFSTDMFSRFILHGDSLAENDMRVKANFVIEDGGVYNYEPVTSMSKFTGINELDNIKFKTLDSDIFIFKGAIYVPQTYISSTALDVAAYGMQSFGDDYEYHVEIQLAEILFGKSKKKLKKQAKSGDEVKEIEGGTRELVVYSLDGKSKNGFDNESLQKDMKMKIKMKKKMLSARFNPRLVNFDTNVYSEK